MEESPTVTFKTPIMDDTQDDELERSLQSQEDEIRKLHIRQELLCRKAELDKERLQLELEIKRQEEKGGREIELLQRELGEPILTSTPMRTRSVCLETCIALDTTLKQQQVIVDSLQLPKVELIHFDGSPLDYYPFVRRFDQTMMRESLTDAIRLNTLLSHCKGKARKAITCCEIKEPTEGYILARKLLEERFGQPATIVDAWVDKVVMAKPVKTADDVLEYADMLRNCKETLLAMDALGELETKRNLRTIIEKLPHRLITKWLSRNQEILKSRNPRLEDVVTFIEKAAKEMSDPVFGSLLDSKKPRERSVFSTSATQEQAASSQSRSCYYCQGSHYLMTCPTFKALRIKDRITWTHQEKRCLSCFRTGHFMKDCPRKIACGIDGCSSNHSRFLHRSTTSIPPSPPDSTPIPQSTEPLQPHVASSSYIHEEAKVALPILSVQLKARDGSSTISTLALLDPGSTTTFIAESAALRLGAHYRPQTLRLTTMTGTREFKGKVTDLIISDSTGSVVLEARAHVRPELNVSLRTFATDKELEDWPHLKGIPIATATGEVEMIIGGDVPQALTPLDVVAGKAGEPYATRTVLSHWVVNGPVGKTDTSSANSYYAEADVERFWRLENPDSGKRTSVTDGKVLQFWESSCKLIDGHYELPIPLKERPPFVDPNRFEAERRLRQLGRRFARDPNLHESYSKTIKTLEEKGYSEKAPDIETKHATYYMPHHPVLSDNKPGKVRVVYDCNAKTHGMSLNEVAHQGPDLTNTLVGVLLRFRQELVAITADIEGMFHQVKVDPDDRDLLRFLWCKDDDPKKRHCTLPYDVPCVWSGLVAKLC